MARVAQLRLPASTRWDNGGARTPISPHTQMTEAHVFHSGVKGDSCMAIVPKGDEQRGKKQAPLPNISECVQTLSRKWETGPEEGEKSSWKMKSQFGARPPTRVGSWKA